MSEMPLILSTPLVQTAGNTEHLILLVLVGWTHICPNGIGIRMNASIYSCSYANLDHHIQEDLSGFWKSPIMVESPGRKKMLLVLGHCAVSQQKGVKGPKEAKEAFFLGNEST